jgi:hypothetical protein
MLESRGKSAAWSIDDELLVLLGLPVPAPLPVTSALSDPDTLADAPGLAVLEPPVTATLLAGLSCAFFLRRRGRTVVVFFGPQVVSGP